MDKSAIEKFSINARIKLRNSVDSSMAKLGFGPGREVESIQSVGDITVITLPGGIQTRITNDEAKYRERLAEVISKDGYDNVVEQVAYTWFNRLIAIRYMEVNDFLPTHVRVLSSNNPDKTEPDLVSQCLTVNLGLSDPERETITELRDADRLDELFSKMFIFECRSLNRILPELFTLTKPYENMLLNLSYTSPDSVVRSLVDDIPEDDFRDAVQIIGWMYQYYNSELKDQTFADLKKNVKILKERIPAATQLFTPDWIVRYMVENSVGRVWLEGHPDQSLRSSWKYFVDEAEQEPDVAAKLAEIRAPRAEMMPTDIKVIDPCMGSGHILVYAFDVLMQIYLSYGYSKSDAAEMILTDNLYGLDIDDRAYQLAYFAVMMKARQYDPDVFSKNLKPNLHSIPESNGIDVIALDGYGKNMAVLEQNEARNGILQIISTFKDAKMCGSLLKMHDLNWCLVDEFLKDCTRTIYTNPDTNYKIHEMVDVAKVLSAKYDAVITNPPYMSISGASKELSDFVKDYYPLSRYDLYACFIERCLTLANEVGFTSMITQQSFMFLTSFKALRNYLLNNTSIFSLLHLGSRSFDQIGGEVVQSVVFIMSKKPFSAYLGSYYRLLSGNSEKEKEELFLYGKHFEVKQNRFNLIPEMPLTSYWLDDAIISCFIKGKPLSHYATVRVGLQTGDNSRFTRLWFEVSRQDISYQCDSREESVQSGKKWFQYNKGGENNRWYGNNTLVVNWKDDGYEIRTNTDANGKLRSVLRNLDYYFKNGYTYTELSTSSFSARYTQHSMFDTKGPTFFSEDECMLHYIAGILNSKIGNIFLTILSPGLDYTVGSVSLVPIICGSNNQMTEILNMVKDNVKLCKEEWDKNEISPDFLFNPLINIHEPSVEKCIKLSKANSKSNNELIYNNERTIDCLLSEIYRIDYDPAMQLPQNVIKDTKTDRQAIVDLISFAVGCIFGRYSLNHQGLHYAGGIWSDKYYEDIIDSDNIVPINDSEYFGDDVVSKFVDFIKITFGSEQLENNLKLIANCLGIKGTGTARDKIRSYFLNDFYKDHLRMYSNLPIYWLFDSGKANGFKALIYMHRYTPDLIGKMRQDYLLPMQRRYTEQLKTESDSIARSKLEKKLEEIVTYDLAMELYSSNKVSIDLDDGIKVNYAKFQNIDNPGGKGKINLLYKIK